MHFGSNVTFGGSTVTTLHVWCYIISYRGMTGCTEVCKAGKQPSQLFEQVRSAGRHTSWKALLQERQFLAAKKDPIDRNERSFFFSQAQLLVLYHSYIQATLLLKILPLDNHIVLVWTKSH